MGSRKSIINVHRKTAAAEFFEHILKSLFDPRRQLDVNFLNDDGTPEDGIDEGGLTGELLTLAMEAVKQLPIYTGTPLSSGFKVNMQGCRIF